MLSRVAENLYWSARYLERADNLSRVVMINNLLLMDLPKGVSTGWEPLLDIVGVKKGFYEHYKTPNEQNVIKYLITDERNTSSLASSIANARNNLRSVREVLPRHTWQLVNSLYLYIQEHQKDALSKRARFTFFEHVSDSILTIFGALDATMSHNVGFTFLRFGMYVERADMTSRILDVRSATLIEEDDEKPFENIQWVSVLRSMSAYQMYRQSMGVKVKRRHVVEFILQDRYFPRSIAFCLSKLLMLGQDFTMSKDLERRLLYSIDSIQAQDVDVLKGKALHDFIDSLQVNLAEVHALLCDQFFTLPRETETTLIQMSTSVAN